MSEESRLYGCVIGVPTGRTSDWYGLYPLNHAVIDSLPLEDDYPPLTRGIFTVPMDFRQPGSAFYRQQVIHFGASFNHFSEYWHLWIQKFENLLRRMYWLEARLHLEVENHGSHDYRWVAARAGNELPFHHIPPRPTTEWTFEGGPKDLRAAE